MPTSASIELGNQIIQALGNNVLSTSELATAVQANRDRVYRQCRRLEREELLAHGADGRPALYCVDCRKVVTKDTYQTCRNDEHDLRSFLAGVCVWEVTQQAAPQTSGIVLQN